MPLQSIDVDNLKNLQMTNLTYSQVLSINKQDATNLLYTVILFPFCGKHEFDGAAIPIL